MNHSSECGEALEMGDERKIDRISSLPDDLLVQIFSYVSTLTAVQTSILSTRWRYLFTLTSNLSIDCQEYYGIYTRSGRELDEVLKCNLERFIDGVLASHKKSPIEKFSLSLGQNPSDHDCSRIHEWINAAILKKVRHLHLGIVTSHSDFVPDCAFNSQTVEVLEIISYGEFLDVPRLVCFPNLRSLELYSLSFFDGDSFKRFLDGCPQLKDLTLRCSHVGGYSSRDTVYISANGLQNLRISWCYGHVVIDAPNLVNLTYDCQLSSADQDVTTSLENPFRLDRVKLCFPCSKMDKIPQIVHYIITGALSVKELTLESKSLELLERVTGNQKPYSMLQSLQFGYFAQKMWKHVSFLLAHSPQLETVIFKAGLVDNDAVHKWLPEMELAPFSSNVKTIKVHRFGGSKPELLLLKYLLGNAGALRILTIYKLKTLKIAEELEISKELLMLPKASIDFTLEFEYDETGNS